VKEPETLEALLILLKKHGVMHFAGGVEVDFACAMCSPDRSTVEEQEPVLATVTPLPVEPPDPVNKATGLTRSQEAELFSSSEP
jgi:hypothetical protein